MNAEEEMEKYRLQLEALERRESDQYKIGYLTRAVNDLSVFIKEHMEREEKENAAFKKEISKLKVSSMLIGVAVTLQLLGVPADKIIASLKLLVLGV